MGGKFSVSYVDYGGEVSTVSVHIATLAVGNIVAQTGLMNALKAALADVTLMNEVKDTRTASVVKTTVVLPTDTEAQREFKWLVRATTNTNGLPVSFEIPGADTSLLLANTDRMDLAGTEGAALVSAIEDVVLSNTGEGITVSEVLLVGRTL